MGSTLRFSKTAWLLGCALALALAACGGGGSASTGTGTGTGGEDDGAGTDRPTAVALSSSDGNLARYIGRWTSACGNASIASSNARSGTGTYEFGAALSATVMPGTISAIVYESINCSGTPSRIGPTPFTATFVSSANPVATANPSRSAVIFSGSADRISLQEHESDGRARGDVRTQFVAFSNAFTELRIEGSSTFSANDVAFKK